MVRTEKEDPATNEEAVALWRISLKDSDERKVGRGIFNAVNELVLVLRRTAFLSLGRHQEVRRAFFRAAVFFIALAFFFCFTTLRFRTLERKKLERKTLERKK